jgi:hypothetical protein
MSINKGMASYEERWELRPTELVYIKNSLYRFSFKRDEIKAQSLDYWVKFLNTKPWHIDRRIPDFKNHYWAITNEK